MTIRIQADHKTEGVCHRWFPDGQFGTLSFGQEGLANHLYFDSTADVDAVMAELAALRAEMAGACGNIAPHTGLPCTETGEHTRHRNGMVVWGPGVTEPAPCGHARNEDGECPAACDEPASHGPRLAGAVVDCVIAAHHETPSAVAS